jgi:predicted Zn-dependent protease
MTGATLHSAAPVQGARRVLARDDMFAVGTRLLSMISDRTIGFTVEHVARAVTVVTNGRVRTSDDGDRVRIRFETKLGSDLPIDISTNQIDDASLRRVVARVEAMAPPLPLVREPEDPDDKAHFTYQAQPQRPSALWHGSTAEAMETGRGEVLPGLIEAMERSKLAGSATVGVASRAVLHMYKYGLTAYADETDCEITMTARTPDGTSSGWAGQSSRDWKRLTPERIAAHAIELAERGRNRSAVEPGRRTAILGPVAIAQLVDLMAEFFDANRAFVRPPSSSPFSNPHPRPGARSTKLDQRVFDNRLVFISDPADPDGGYAPFYEHGGCDGFMAGYPQDKVTWIDGGILRQFADRVANCVLRQLPPCDIPRSVRVTTVPGTKTATLEEMIAACEDGIYVNRLDDVEVLDSPEGRSHGIMMGYTRDGCFLIRDGKINRPVKNFRFMESPFLAFNRVEMVGTPVRAAFGYNVQPRTWSSWARWPKLPIITPPMMIRDFNFVALSDAI